MAQPYVGEIRMFGGNFAPAGWNFCDGTLLSISENETLFQLIGTTYGGDGQSTFAVPDLRGRIPIHMGTSSSSGTSYVLAEAGGVETVTLSTNNMPAHTHVLMASSATGTTAVPDNVTFAVVSGGGDVYNSDPGTPQNLVANMVSSVGGNQPHDNMQPYLCVSFIISLYGIFPSPT